MANERQLEEFKCLESILSGKELQLCSHTSSCCSGGTFFVPLVLDEANVSVNGSSVSVKYLPPIALNFKCPSDYPESTAPTFTLSAKCLSRRQLSKLCRQLDKIWLNNTGSEVLFSWYSFLQNETVEFLRLSKQLDLSKVVSTKPVKMRSGSDRMLKRRRANGSSRHGVDERAIHEVAKQDELLPMIVAYDEAMRRQEFNDRCFECVICMTVKKGADMRRLGECEHVFCVGCLRAHFCTYVDSGDVMQMGCPAEKCSTVAPNTLIEELVPAATFERYRRLHEQRALDSLGGRVAYCPRTFCQTAIILDRADDQLAECPQCRLAFCTLCRATYHGVTPCKVTNNALSELLDAYENMSESERDAVEKRYGQQRIRTAYENRSSLKAIGEQCKRCPKCTSPIYKLDGCNKMTCVYCHAYFCWLCSALLSAADPYFHFNDNASNCNGRLFESNLEHLDSDDDGEFFDDEDEDDDDEDFDAFEFPEFEELPGFNGFFMPIF